MKKLDANLASQARHKMDARDALFAVAKRGHELTRIGIEQEEADRDKRSPGEEEAERWKLPDRTQWVNWNPTRERLAIPRKRVLRRRQRWRHEA